METRRSEWKARNVRSYEWVIKRDFWSTGPTLRVRVIDGSVRRATLIASDTPVGPICPEASHATTGCYDPMRDALTVDDLFDRLFDAIDEGYQLSATFDRDLSYPSEAGLTIPIPDASGAYRVRSFVVLLG